MRFLYCAPHTFDFGDDVARMVAEAAPVLAHVHLADTFRKERAEASSCIMRAEIQRYVDRYWAR